MGVATEGGIFMLILGGLHERHAVQCGINYYVSLSLTSRKSSVHLLAL
jgi:hypothetical protein